MAGSAKKDEDGTEVAVEPVLFPNSHPLASVNNEYNAVYIYGDAVGETMFYGPGAGPFHCNFGYGRYRCSMPELLLGVNGKRVHAPQYERKVKSDNNKYASYFHRILVKDQVGVLSKLTAIYSSHGASLATVMQHPDKKDVEAGAELIFITHQMSRQQHLDIVEELNETSDVINVLSHYRVEGEEK